MSSRTIEINDEALKELVVKKGDMVKAGKELIKPIEDDFKAISELNAKIQEIVAERNTLQEKINPVLMEADEKGKEIDDVKKEIVEGIEKHLKDEDLGEFEVYTSTEIKDDKLVVTIIDQLELWKTNYKANKEKNV